MKTRNKPLIALGALLLAGVAQAQTYRLEGAVIDSRDAKSLGVVTEAGSIDSLFRAQKAMTFGILRAAGISLDDLSPEVRARIERFATTNLEAFRAFSQGLELKDQGRFVEAREFFRRAAELDPNFALAAEQQRAMPEVNVGSNLQLRAVLAAATTTAVDKGKTVFAVDTGRALAALSLGGTLVALTNPAQQDPAQGFTANPPGSAGGFRPNIVAGYAYAFAPTAGTVVSVANAAEWRGDSYQLNGGDLLSLGQTGNFVALKQSALDGVGGSLRLADGSSAYWGSWVSVPGSSASVSSNGIPYTAPALGSFDYVHGEATRVMPARDTVAFSPVNLAGSLGNPTGTIAVDFGAQKITLQNLGFSLNGLVFSGLAGETNYDTRPLSGSPAGTFNGRYSAGACDRCASFDARTSTFGGSFIGRNAEGLVFSTLLSTGTLPVGGVQLFVKP